MPYRDSFCPTDDIEQQRFWQTCQKRTSAKLDGKIAAALHTEVTWKNLNRNSEIKNYKEENPLVSRSHHGYQ